MEKTKQIEEKVKKFIINNDLIKKDERIMIALSGGSDSVCLFHILNKLKMSIGFELFAFHLNHNIRQEAKHDELFVKKLCEEYGIKLFLESIDIPKIRTKENLGLEELSRKIRYDLINKISTENNIDKTATAHHLLDHSESIILNMVRGSGIRGLRGIGIKNGNIIRPMLVLSKDEILDYIKENNLEYVTDKTNFDTDYSRNNIRHNVLPHLKEVNNNAFMHFFELSMVAEEIEDLLNELSKKVKFYHEKNGVYIFINDFIDLNKAVKKQVLFNMLRSIKVTKDISSKHVNKIIDLISKNKTTFDLNISNDIIVKRRYDKLYFEYNNQKRKEEIYINVENKDYFDININEYQIKLKKIKILEKNNEDKYVDYDKIENNLFIRNRKEGDVFSPFGLKGSKKLKKYFIDKKIPKEKRDSIPLLVDGENIVAVIGYDISEKYKTDKNTKNILNIHYNIER